MVTRTFGNECIGEGFISFDGVNKTPCIPNKSVFIAGVGGKIENVIFSGNTDNMSPGSSADVNPPSSPGSAIMASNFVVKL